MGSGSSARAASRSGNCGNLPASHLGRRFASFRPREVALVVLSAWKGENGGGCASREWSRENPLPSLEIDIKRLGRRGRRTSGPQPVGPATSHHLANRVEKLL